MPYHLLLDIGGRARSSGKNSRSARPSAASAPPTPTRPRAWASACRTCSTRRSSRRRSPPRSSPSACSCARSRRTRALDLHAMTEEYLTYGHRLEQHIADTRALAWRALDDGQARALRGRAGRAAGHRPRHLSVRDLVEPGRGRRVRRRGRRARATSTRSGASPRPTPRASAPARSRPSWTTSSARRSASAAASSARRPAARAAPAGSTSSRCATRRASTADRAGHHQARRAQRLRDRSRSARATAAPRTRTSTTVPLPPVGAAPRDRRVRGAARLDRGHQRGAAARATCRRTRATTCAFIEEAVGVPVVLIGVGPGREQIIWTEAAKDSALAPEAMAATRA